MPTPRTSRPLVATSLAVVAGAVAIAVLLDGAPADDPPTVTAEPSAVAETPASATPPPDPTSEPTATGTDVGATTPETPAATGDDGEFVLATWLERIPAAADVGGDEVRPGRNYALRADADVRGVTAVGGRSAAVLADGPVTISDSFLGGATDGLKPSDGTTLTDSVVSVAYGEGAHADHVQIRDDDSVTVERVRFIAENSEGTTDEGWNAAVFVHADATDWIIRDVLIEAGRPEFAISSWFPLRLYSGAGTVERVVVDRAAMKSDNVVGIGSETVIEVWRDVYIREPDGSLTPVPDPTG